MNRLINIEEARQMLGGIGRSTIYRLIDAKLLRAKRLGNRTMLTPEAISEYINNLEDYEGGPNAF